MKKCFIVCLSILFVFSCKSELSSEQVLEKAITYHDPNNNWPTFNNSFNVVMETPNSPDRDSRILINIPDESFYSIATTDSVTTRFEILKGVCKVSKTDSIRIANQDVKPKRSHCETTELFKNYYTYLYGLPMKLKDPGTNIDDVVERKTFKDKEYLVFKATYDKAVGSDIWYFYFDPETYAMEVYQFFKTDDNGITIPESGEYILLSDISFISDIKMPKVRAWYYNKDDKYLGTDTIK